MIAAPGRFVAPVPVIAKSSASPDLTTSMCARTWIALKFSSLAVLLLTCLATPTLLAQTIEQRLQAESPATLVADARALGDPVRGAILFHQPWLGCTKCHTAGAEGKPLGPELARAEKETTAAHLVESVLDPSRKIRDGYQAVVVELKSGKTQTGILVERKPDAVSFRDLEQGGKSVTIPTAEIEELKLSDQSLMPAGLVNALSSRQQFLDLAVYLLEIAEKGPARALELQPSPALYAAATLPEYEQRLDHRALILAWNDASLARGEAIYNRVCANCHGTPDRPGSLPTSLKFASGKFKNGSEPYAMYQTLTRGFGLMAPQTWMVPRQKYDVIHYIRERYLREPNPGQYARVDEDYLRGLPAGDTLGPEPSSIDPWAAMDYGPTLMATYETGNDASNFAYKGIAFRLDAGPGGVSRGQHWMIFDHDTLRVSAAWSRTSPDAGFIDWNSILFNGAHGAHPRLVGTVAFGNHTGPGWANPADGSWIDPRLRGRDDRPYGPLPRKWARYRGLYHYGAQSVVSYSVGAVDVLESPGVMEVEWPRGEPTPEASQRTVPVFTRTINFGPRPQELVLQVAERNDGEGRLSLEQDATTRVARWGTSQSRQHANSSESSAPLTWDGRRYLQLNDPPQLSFDSNDLTVVARIKTRKGGTIISQTQPGAKWVPGGKSLFVRDGRLCFDIGWVGAVTSRQKVDDGRWHDIACQWKHQTGELVLWIDGAEGGKGKLKSREPLANAVIRLGFTAPDFPQPQSLFEGEMAFVRLYAGVLSAEQRQNAARTEPVESTDGPRVRADWRLDGAKGDRVSDAGGGNFAARVQLVERAGEDGAGDLLAGVVPPFAGVTWEAAGAALRLRIPAGSEPLRMTIWTANVDSQVASGFADQVLVDEPGRDLTAWTKGGAPRWPQKLTVPVQVGNSEGAMAVDVLTLPDSNPWLALVRPTGLDFVDADKLAVCTWDGDVWLVSGVSRLAGVGDLAEPNGSVVALEWQRIASGLFQPLGLKIVGGKIHVTCRDQLVVLHDFNGDGETDYYQCLNNDHQVTEHFHEFAMGLQTDSAGNFYYAKSARHALPAVVPHHGTLLKVSPDGETTEILATGFRAANGVCLNPDGSFIVTDQEGHWNPKNRINRVEPGKFYGNMFGYHDVTDSSDSAMEPPLCWITNAFDRSPAELLWVTSDAWGPLKGSLLNFSYGYGKIFVVPQEEVAGRCQGGMCELPLPVFPTGLIRGRFSPFDGQLFTCGMFAWAGSATQPGGLYRVRMTGNALHVPVALHATTTGLTLKFSGRIDPATVTDTQNFTCRIWDLKRTANYGSDHYNERKLEVQSASLDDDRQTLRLRIAGMVPTWCMEVRWALKSSAGQPVRGVMHNTIHRLGEP